MLSRKQRKGFPVGLDGVLNCALNAAVHAKLIVVNPLNVLERSEKIRLPESKRSYMSIEKVRALKTKEPKPRKKKKRAIRQVRPPYHISNSLFNHTFITGSGITA